MRSEDLRSFGVFQIVVLVLSIYALGALLLDALFPLSPEATRVIQLFDFVVCAVFFADFVLQLARAEDRWAYMRKWGWIDLLASIPAIDPLRWGRLFRILRILRVLRAIRGLQKLLELLRSRNGVGGSVAVMAFMILALCSLLILPLRESGRGKHPNGERRHLVEPDHRHHGGLWGPLPGDRCGKDGGSGADDRGRGVVRQFHRAGRFLLYGTQHGQPAGRLSGTNPARTGRAAR